MTDPTRTQPEPAGLSDEELLKIAAKTINPYEDYGICIDEYEAETECAVEAYGSELIAFARAVEAATLARVQRQPVPVSERLPGHIEQALIKAECALADIAEGEAEESEGDPLKWAEKRAADALARIRLVMRQHHIHTSEWPPLPAHALPLPVEVKG